MLESATAESQWQIKTEVNQTTTLNENCASIILEQIPYHNSKYCKQAHPKIRSHGGGSNESTFCQNTANRSK